MSTQTSASRTSPKRVGATGRERREGGIRSVERLQKAKARRASAGAWRPRGAPLAGAGTWPRPAGSEPGPGPGGRRLRGAQRTRPRRLGGGSPQTRRGGWAPSRGQTRRAAELQSSPARALRPGCGRRAGVCLLQGHPPHLLPGPQIHPEFTPLPALKSASATRTRAGPRGSTEPEES